MESLTIAHVLTSFNMGGGEQVALSLAGAQVELGHHVHVVGIDGGTAGPLAEYFVRAGAKPRRLARIGASVDPSLPLRMASSFASWGVSLVHTHNAQPLIYAGCAARLARIPLVHTTHGSSRDTARRDWLRRLAGRAPQRFVAVSEQTREAAQRDDDCPSERLRVIPNGVDLTAYYPDAECRRRLRAEFGIPAGAWVVGSVGRLCRVKNHGLLIAALAPHLSETSRLVIVGEGDARAALEREVLRLAGAAAQYVHLVGQRFDVPRWLRAFDVFALSSSSEGLPMVLLEAMASGLPVVSTDVGGVSEIVLEGQTGHLVPTNDVGALRSRLAELARDPERAKRFGGLGRERALGQHGAGQMVSAYMQLYSELVGAAGATPPRRT